MRLWVAVLIVAPATILFLIDFFFGCMAAARNDTGRCDGTPTPMLLVASILLAMVVVFVITVVRAVRR